MKQVDMTYQNKYQNKSATEVAGFTLIELLVSIGLFGVVALIASSSLVVLIDANDRTQQLSTAISNLSFSLDAMTRNIRTGLEYHCSDGGDPFGGSTSDCVSGGDTFGYTDGRTGDRVAYRYNAGNMQLEINEDDTAWVPITSDAIKLTDLVFFTDGTTAGDNEQPHVFISIEGYVFNNEETDTDFTMQSSITQRLLDL
jgi:prepilin-type N-terminal cleavage/methylation domain-containing protein